MRKVAVIGAGLQAKRRIPAIMDDPECQLKYIIGRNEDNAKKLGKQYGVLSGCDWQKAVEDKDIDMVLVLTPPDSHAEISIAAMEKSKDVLCEKPLARTEQEAKKMIEVARKTKRILKCGFNHRHHPAILKAYDLYKSNSFGKALFARSVYGIAGREGIKGEWRSDQKMVGGGQMMEQGIHVVDLARWFLGDIDKITGMVNTNYWPMEPLEDNAFVILQTKAGVMMSIHSSFTQWINLFEFEIYGEKGFFKVQGLGSSYGNEKLIYGSRGSGPFSYETIEYRGGDVSWKNEWQEFTRAVTTRRQPMGNGIDGLKSLEIVNAVYKSSKTGKRIELG